MKNSLETSPPAPPANSKPRCGTSWTASSVLDEDPRDTVRREVLEETCVTVETGQLTGVYKNMRLGVVSLVFRCRPLAGAAEATEVAWLDSAQVNGRMAEAFGIGLIDALETYEPHIRIHDGQHLLS